jgi:hypothetical protein
MFVRLLARDRLAELSQSASGLDGTLEKLAVSWLVALESSWSEEAILLRYHWH